MLISLSPPDCAFFRDSLLSPEERVRAARFRFSEHARGFRACHAVLRLILEHYANQPAETMRFVSGPAGKPFIADATQVCFHLSHADEVALVVESLEAEMFMANFSARLGPRLRNGAADEVY